MIDLISSWMGYALRFFYDLTLNYGLAIILFTIFVKVVLIPLTLKQQKSLKASQELQPILIEIQNKYKNNPEKQQQELARIYQEKKINPFGGCLLMLIQFPIILAMFYAVAQPITYMFPKELENPQVVADIDEYKDRNNTYKEVYYISEQRKDLLNTNFLGLDLAQVPTSNKSNVVLWIIPILSVITTFMTSKINMKQTAQNSEGNEQAVAMQKNMSLMLPLMTGYISFIVPLGMGLYWLVNNIVSMLIQMWVNRIVNGTPKAK